MEYRVPSVALAAQALKLLSRQKYKSCSLKAIAEKLHANPSTCLRVLRTLEREGFVRFDAATKTYSLGNYLIPLGNRAAQLDDTITRASPAIKRIAMLTGLTTALLQRWDDRLVYIATAEPLVDGVRLSISAGQQTPLASGAHGRCFLAFDDEAEWHRFIAAGLRPVTPATITDPQRFIEALREVRRNGYAVSHGEFAPGFSAIDVPIFGKTGRVELVMSCMCVTAQLDDARLSTTIQLLRAASRELSGWSVASEQWSAASRFADEPVEAITI